MTVDQPTDEDRTQASPKNIEKMWKFVEHFANKSGSYLHPQREITEFLVIGLAKHIEEVGKPLCPCNFYEDKAEEARSSTWVCACDEMQKWKYCHGLLFCDEEGLPITEYLPEDHEGREIYGLVKDPHPDKGRALGRLEEKRGRTLEKRRLRRPFRARPGHTKNPSRLRPNFDCSNVRFDRRKAIRRSARQLDGTTVTCLCHSSEFDVTTGAVLSGPADARAGRASRRAQPPRGPGGGRPGLRPCDHKKRSG